ncbi:MAG TPA: class I adenylate-forming enzyme family protein [Steroidobacteraceae bacterium]|nr:class I adenylate-forming enzyme family protein [Steroidobacteraceae bacterium]
MDSTSATMEGNLGKLLRRDVPAESGALIDLLPPRGAWTCGELDAAADAFADALTREGLHPDARVAILSENCAEHLIAYMGIMRAGAVAVPVNHRLPAETVRFILEDCTAGLCIVDRVREPLLPAALRRIRIRGEGADGFDAYLKRGTAPFTARGAPSGTAEILYTSGSTGRPKGVVLSHAGQLWALSVHVTAQPATGERSLIVAPLYHMNALFNLSVCLLNGIEVVLMPRFDAAAHLKATAEYRCTHLSGIPTMFALMARQQDLIKTLDLSSVKAVTIGSAPLTEALVERVQAMFPQAAISNGYGTTEAGPSIFEEHPGGVPRPLLSLGYPLPEVEVRLVGGATADEGVLQVRSPAMFTEYLNLPAVTHEKLQDGWYDSGDVMRRDAQGFYYFTGRADDMFVCGGENVFPGEVEKMLERHPAVLQAAVVPVPDEIKGEIPIAFVVLKDRSVTPEELKRFALESGPAFSHPRAFVVVDELPVASTHKLDKRPLMARALEVAKALKR